MKILLSIFLLFGLSIQAQKLEQIEIYSEVLNQDRKVLVYLPWQYYENPDRRFEVFYIFDAQTREMFDYAHSSFKLKTEGKVPFIFVGIQSPNFELGEYFYGRNTDLLPKAKNNEKTRKFFFGKLNGNAAKLREHLVKELFPFIDQSYRTLPMRVGMGHSNSATFLMDCFLENTDMFDGYIMQSPNFAYDQEQLVTRIESFDFSKIHQEKFLFLSHANEANYWKRWKNAREKVYEILKRNLTNSKINYVHKAYPDLDHAISYLRSSQDGMQEFLEYQFFDADKILDYYKSLESKGLFEYDSFSANLMAYQFYQSNKVDDAMTVINWAISRSPNDDNLHDSKGEFFLAKGNNEMAQESFLKAIDLLKMKKDKMDSFDYDQKMKAYKTNYEKTVKKK